MAFSSQFYSGTSGLLLPIAKYQFPAPYENASRLTYYATLYNSLEVNGSFYKVPQGATLSKWADSVPDDFNFTFKLWKGITHHSGLNFKEEDVVHFMETINQVGSKKGCLLIQFPPSIGHHSLAPLEKLLKCIRKSDSTGWDVAVEFRNKSWYHESTFKLLDAFDTTPVIHDMPNSATPQLDHLPKVVYVRLHGPTGKYDGSYSENFLCNYAHSVNEWITAGKKVYLYFNNTIGDALKNLNQINGFIHEKQKKHA